MRPEPRTGASALIGLLSGAAALGVAELGAAVTGPRSGPVIAVGGAMVDRTPEWLKDFAIRTFGTHDKQVLLAGTGVAVALLAIAAGLAARRSLRLGVALIALLGLVGAVAALTRPGAGPSAVLPSVLGTLAGAGALVGLVHSARPAPDGPAPDGPAPDGPAPDVREAGSGGGRRTFLLAASGTAALALVSGGLGRLLTGRRNVEAARRAVRFPVPAETAPPLPAGADLRLRGLTPFVTPNQDFYRVDTALVLPQVDPAEWTLRIHGMVDRPLELTFDELLRLPLHERDVTLTCVSNEVGGPYVGNARWLGASLPDLLRRAGVRPGADQLLSRSADGWTCGTPIDTLLDGRDALLAVAMNGEPLPVKHGFPARMVVPGLYGYVSATKWVVDLKVTRFTDDTAYWTARDWADHAPIKTLSRIDVPKPLQRVKAGRVPVAGTAWAQRRGIEAVQVRVDGGPWRSARLAPVPHTDTWRQWVLEWDAAPGTHRIEARAVDGSGAVQPEARVPPFPDGATGWHSVVVTVG